MSTAAQRRATKKYLDSKKRINVIFDPDQVDYIQNVIKEVGYFDSLPEFIRYSVEYFLEEIERGNVKF